MFLKQLHFLISPEHKKSYLSPLWLQEILMYNFYLCRCHLLSYPDDRKNTQELHGGEGEVVFRMSLFNVWWVKATAARMFLHLLKCLLAKFPPQISKVKAHLLKHQNFPLLRSFYYQKSGVTAQKKWWVPISKKFYIPFSPVAQGRMEPALYLWKSEGSSNWDLKVQVFEI